MLFDDGTAATSGGGIFVEPDSGAWGSGVVFYSNSPDDISRGTKKEYTADKKGDFSCPVSSKVCE